ncbi:MAG: hypothetical protein NTV30_01065 [Chloroflexi bacterium]|nr:hypothetical protein [Chloroflexota bacterium]
MNTEQKLPDVVTGKKAVIFDLFHTLTDIESAWPGTKMTPELLGISRDAWNEQLEKARWRLTGEETEPYTIIKRMAHAINPKNTRFFN